MQITLPRGTVAELPLCRPFSPWTGARWTVRPVAEIFYEEEFGQAHTISGLIGAIWQVRDNLSFDVGFRRAIVNGANVNEVRAGLTVGFPLRLLVGPNHKRRIACSVCRMDVGWRLICEECALSQHLKCKFGIQRFRACDDSPPSRQSRPDGIFGKDTLYVSWAEYLRVLPTEIQQLSCRPDS
jgi:hypothetical protein